MRLAWLIAPVVLMLSAAPLQAGETRSLAAGASAAPAVIDDFAWLAGRWRGEGLGGQVEQAWSPAAKDAMIGHFRSAGPDGPRFYEIALLREEEGSVVFRVKHFHPDLKGWEDKDATIDFRLVARDGDTFFFDGVTVQRQGPDALREVVMIEHKDGSQMEAAFTYQRVK